MSENKTRYTEEEFREHFKPLPSPSGDQGTDIWSWAEVKDQDPLHVWSIVEGDDYNWYALAGFHVVNMVGYSVTTVPADCNIEEAVFSIDETETGLHARCECEEDCSLCKEEDSDHAGEHDCDDCALCAHDAGSCSDPCRVCRAQRA